MLVNLYFALCTLSLWRLAVTTGFCEFMLNTEQSPLFASAWLEFQFFSLISTLGQEQDRLNKFSSKNTCEKSWIFTSGTDLSQQFVMHPKLKVNFTAKFNFFVGFAKKILKKIFVNRFCSFSSRRRGEKTFLNKLWGDPMRLVWHSSSWLEAYN